MCVCACGSGDGDSDGGKDETHKRCCGYFHECIKHSIGIQYFDSIEISQRIINHNF